MAFNPNKEYQVLDEDQFDPSKPYEETPTGLSSLNEPVQASAPSQIPFAGIDTSTPTTARGFAPPTQIQEPSGAAQLASDIYTPLLEYGGAGVGAAAGFAAAGGPTPLSLATVPAAGGIGFAGGASLADQLDQLIGLKPSGKFLSLPTTEQVKSDVEEYADKLREGAGVAVGGEIGGAVLNRALQATATGAAKAIAKGPEYIAALKETAGKLGINLTPAEIVGSKSLSMMEHILDNLPWTSGIVQRYRAGEIQKLNTMREKLIEERGSPERIEELGIQIKNMADQFMQKVGTVNKDAMNAMKNRLLEKVGSRSSYEDLDISAKEVVARYEQKLASEVSDAYNGVAARIPDFQAPPNNTIKVAQDIIKQQEELPAAARNNQLYSVAKFFARQNQHVPPEIAAIYSNPQTNPLIKKQLEEQFPEILNTGTEKTYSQLVSNLKRINELKYSNIENVFGTEKMSKLGKDYADFASAINDDLATFAKASGNEEIVQAQKIANDLYIKKLNLFKDPAFRAINNKSPGAVSKAILESGNVELIDKYKSLVGKDLFDKTRDRLTNDVLGLGPEQTVIGDDIRKRLTRLGTSAKSIYSDQELQYFQDIAKATDIREAFNESLFRNPFLKKIVRDGEIVPQKLAANFIAPQNIGRAKLMERFLGKEGVRKTADAFLPELMATNQATGNFMPQTFAKTFDEYGYDTLSAWYGKEFADKLKDVALVGRNLGGAESVAGNPSGTGRFLITYFETKNVATNIAKALTNVATMGGAAGAVANPMMTIAGESALIFGPRQLAKLYLSPAGRKLFVDGLMTPRTAKEASQVGGKILAILGNELLGQKENQK